MTKQSTDKLFVLQREQEGRLVRIDLNRPDEGNAVTREMMVALTELIADIGRDPSVHVVSIEGRGNSFCRGRDAKGDNRSGMSAYEVQERVMKIVLGAYDSIIACPLPVVACVHGLAAGFGAALSMACDMTIASDEARFSFPEIHHQIPPALAMSTLVGKVSPKAINYLIYSGREIDADEALGFGLASKVFPSKEFHRQADVLLAEMSARPRVVLQTIKRYERNVRAMPAAMASEYAGILLALAQTEIRK
ncbi:MAG: enoyl-CoA hydratase/isomerase family protein [Pseudolabrys sp.]|nr:enoyl-CoA hydratase/isomerase family protein [Pseudolabrys sp.]